MKSGDVVGLCCDNRREYPIPLISTLLIGCSFAPLNQAYTERKFVFQLLIILFIIRLHVWCNEL